MPRLIVCPACSVHVKHDEPICPHCGHTIDPDADFGRAAGAVLLGLTLVGCPAEDKHEAEVSGLAYGSAEIGEVTGDDDTSGTTGTSGSSTTETTDSESGASTGTSRGSTTGSDGRGTDPDTDSDTETTTGADTTTGR